MLIFDGVAYPSLASRSGSTELQALKTRLITNNKVVRVNGYRYFIYTPVKVCLAAAQKIVLTAIVSGGYYGNITVNQAVVEARFQIPRISEITVPRSSSARPLNSGRATERSAASSETGSGPGVNLSRK